MRILPKALAKFDEFVKRRNGCNHSIGIKMFTGEALQIVKEVIMDNIGDKKIVYPDILDDLWKFLYDHEGDLQTFRISNLEKTASYVLECVTGECEDERSRVRKWIFTQLKDSNHANDIDRIRCNGHDADGAAIYEIQYKGQIHAVFVCLSKDGNMHII